MLFFQHSANASGPPGVGAFSGGSGGPNASGPSGSGSITPGSASAAPGEGRSRTFGPIGSSSAGSVGNATSGFNAAPGSAGASGGGASAHPGTSKIMLQF